MTINEYQKKCVSALPKLMYRGEQALTALTNLRAVSKENVDLYEKTVSEGSELPKEALLDNLVETLFSVAIAADAFDVDLVSVFKRSVEKVNKVLEKKRSRAEADAGDKKEG